jgi:hypothetical protein
MILDWMIKLWKDEITMKEAIKEPKFWRDLIVHFLVVIFMTLIVTIIMTKISFK